MKLFYSAASPFVRKVMISRHRLRPRRPHRARSRPIPGPPRRADRQNPLSKVPCLVTDDGLALFDSPVICEYLDEWARAACSRRPGRRAGAR